MNYWKHLALAGLGITISSALLVIPRPVPQPSSVSSSLIIPNQSPTPRTASLLTTSLFNRVNRGPSPSSASRSLQALTLEQRVELIDQTIEAVKERETEAIAQTKALQAQSWNSQTFNPADFDNAWRSIEMLWEENINAIAHLIPSESNNQRAQANTQTSYVETLIEIKLQPLHQEYVNRQKLTAAYHAHHKSVLLAEQPKKGSSAQCATEASFADSPARWSEVVTLRQKSVDYLNTIATDVSFYANEVRPLQADYQEKHQLADQIYRRSAWYYAIQKAVCATQQGKTAQQSDRPEDWAKTAALWAQAIDRLEQAPDSIPVEIPTVTRDSYQTAKANLDLWRKNQQDAQARATKP